MTSKTETVYARFIGVNYSHGFKAGKVYKLQVTTHTYGFFDKVLNVIHGMTACEVIIFRILEGGNKIAKCPYSTVKDFARNWRLENNNYFAKLHKN